MRRIFLTIGLIVAFSLVYSNRDFVLANSDSGDSHTVSVVAEQTAGSGWTLRKAKAQYKADELSRSQYEAIRRDLKRMYREKVSRLKSDYKQGLTSKEQYKEKVREAKYEYEG